MGTDASLPGTMGWIFAQISSLWEGARVSFVWLSSLAFDLLARVTPAAQGSLPRRGWRGTGVRVPVSR